MSRLGEVKVTEMHAHHNSFVFMAIDKQRVIRAEQKGGAWHIEHVLAGPNPVTLAADPSTPGVVYAGTQGDGIYRSADAGRSWAQFGLAGSAVKSIAISPQNPRVVYAGLRPAALCKTVDGGRNWRELEGFTRVPNRWWWFSPAEAPFQAYVNAIAVSPIEPDAVMVGIELGAVVRSEDGGRTWTGHLSGSIRDCHSLKFHPNGQWVYEAGGTGKGAAVSRNGGRLWSQHGDGLACHYGVTCAADPIQPEIWYVAVAPGPRQAYGENAQAYLYRTIDGSAWQPIGWEPHPMNRMPRTLMTCPGMSGHLYVGTTCGEVWHTADYGDSWQRLPFDLGSGLSLLML